MGAPTRRDGPESGAGVGGGAHGSPAGEEAGEAADPGAGVGGVPLRERPIGRRVVLGMLGLGAAGVLVGERAQDGVDALLSPLRASGISDILPGSGGFVLYTVTGGYPAPPPDYHLQVDGMVERPLSLSVADVMTLPATAMTADFQCVTGWRVDDVHWVGVRLTDLATAAGASAKATAFEFTSFDGVYTESLTRAQAEETGALVAYSMLGKPVTRDHGGPLRLYVPDMFGYKSIKWLSRISLVEHAAAGYWERNGYPVNAWIDGHPPAEPPVSS